jgi:hypothetical protein
MILVNASKVLVNIFRRLANSHFRKEKAIEKKAASSFSQNSSSLIMSGCTCLLAKGTGDRIDNISFVRNKGEKKRNLSKNKGCAGLYVVITDQYRLKTDQYPLLLPY